VVVLQVTHVEARYVRFDSLTVNVGPKRACREVIVGDGATGRLCRDRQCRAKQQSDGGDESEFQHATG
jgi:hypothetical protein